MNGYSLSTEAVKKAQKELNEDPDKRSGDIEHIRKWINDQPHLHIRTDDSFILRFLRGCKFSLEETKEKLDLHFTLKTSLPEWFKDRDPEEIKIRELLQQGIIIPLKLSDDSQSRTFIFRQAIFNPRSYTLNDMMRTLFLFFDVFFEVDEVYQFNGIIIIVDQKDLSMSHIFQYSNKQIQNIMRIWQDGYVLQNRKLYLFNNGTFFHILFNIAKIFMSKEILQIIEVCNSNLELVYPNVPKSILPKEYGGDGDTIQDIIDYWMKIIDSKRHWILEDQKNYVDESKRPKPNNV